MCKSVALDRGASPTTEVQAGKVSNVRRWCVARVRLLGGPDDVSGATCGVVPLVSRDQTRGVGLTRLL